MNRDSALDPDQLTAYLRRRRFARRCAVQYLYQLDQHRGSADSPNGLEAFWEQVRELADEPADLDLARAQEFSEQLIQGVGEHRSDLDRMIGDCAHNWRLERMSVVDRNILRLSAFEIFFRDEVPDVAAVNEAIELAKEFGHKESSRFINGILDRLLQVKRERGTE